MKNNGELAMLPVYLLCVWSGIASFSLLMTEWGILTALALFLAAQYLIRRNARINHAINAYLDAYKLNPYENGLARILKCGVVELKNQRELNEVCRRIVANGKVHPNYYQDVPNKRLLNFLKFCHKNGHDLSSGSDSIIVLAAFDKKFPPES